MITTLTLSPCLDKTIVLGRLDPDSVNRAESSRIDAGGKGINVSLALASLGIKSCAVYIGYEGCNAIGSALKAAGANCKAALCRGRIRTNLKIFDRSSGKTLEINEQNPAPDKAAMSEIFEICRKISEKSDLFVLSGSVPQGVEQDVYKNLIHSVIQENPKIKILLDSSGVPLREGLEAGPYLIKPNKSELEECFGVALKTESETVTFCREIIRSFGIGTVLVSLGAEGALAVSENESYYAEAVTVDAKSAQGAGDAMVAGACLAISKSLPLQEVLKYGVCTAAGAVELEGTAFCSKERFAKLLGVCGRIRRI